MTDLSVLDGLNPAQRAAVTAGEGHLCINAAAGTGKTSTVAARILYLQLVRGVSPRSILAVSFSRAARGHLLERLEHFVQRMGRGSNVTVLTLHGLAFRVLRMAVQYKETWLGPGFTVVSGGRDRLNPLFEKYGRVLLGDLRDLYDFDTRLSLYSRALDLVRQGHPDLSAAVIEPDELPDGEIEVPWEMNSRPVVALDQLKLVWKKYDRYLRRENCIDYAGMLSEALQVLYREGDTLKRFQEGLQYMIVDEYQDTSRSQEELIRQLAGDRVSVNVVGDSDQSIYGFTGANVHNILNFERQMADGTLPVLPPVYLTENYRSSPRILEAANRVLRKVAAQNLKRLEPAAGKLPGQVGEYRERNLPVVRVAANSLEAGAGWVAGEVDRLIRTEGVQPREIAVLVRKDTEHAPQGRLVREALATLGLKAEVQDRDPERTARLLEAVHTFLNEHFSDRVEDLIQGVASGRYADELPNVASAEVIALLEEARQAGAEFGLQAADMVYDMGAPEQSAPDVTGVQVRTVHSAKGLEFRVVFLMYVADRAFPSGARPDLAEERRLYYVGVTRAMERLYVVGRRGIEFPSFFDEVDGDGVQLIQAAGRPDQAFEAATEPAVDDATRAQLAAARRRQKELDAQRRDRR